MQFAALHGQYGPGRKLSLWSREVRRVPNLASCSTIDYFLLLTVSGLPFSGGYFNILVAPSANTHRRPAVNGLPESDRSPLDDIGILMRPALAGRTLLPRVEAR